MQVILDLAARSRDHGFKVSVWTKRSYSEKERLDAELLVLRGEKVVSSSRKGPLTWVPGAGCPHCKFRGTIWRYDTLVVREAPSGFQLRIVDHQVTLVSRAVKDALEEIAATGLDFVEVSALRGGSWFVLTCTHTLPPMLSPPTLFDPPPPQTPCALQHGRSWPKSAIFYARHELHAKDFNYTNEFFGSETQQILISQRVYRVLRSRVGALRACCPVHVIDAEAGSSNNALHRTATGASALDVPDSSDAGFAASARFRRRSVS